MGEGPKYNVKVTHISWIRTFSDQNQTLFGTKLFWTKKVLGLQLFYAIFLPTFFLNQIFLTKIFSDRIIFHSYIFLSKIFGQIFLQRKILFDQLFFDQNMFWTKCSVDQNFYLYKIVFALKSCWPNFIFHSKFLHKIVFRTLFLLGPIFFTKMFFCLVFHLSKFFWS